MKAKKTQRPATKPRATRKPRADGLRNRDLIIATAKDAFAAKGAGASLDEIASKAGVGPGTLYRHFPSREALLGAVYHAEVEKLAVAAEKLSAELAPLEALESWLGLFVEHLATKKVIAAALDGLVGGSKMFEEHQSKIREAVTAIYSRAINAGKIRPDINPVDHLRALVGVTFFGTSEDWRQSATRLIDILILGSRPAKK